MKLFIMLIEIFGSQIFLRTFSFVGFVHKMCSDSKKTYRLELISRFAKVQ